MKLGKKYIYVILILIALFIVVHVLAFKLLFPNNRQAAMIDNAVYDAVKRRYPDLDVGQPHRHVIGFHVERSVEYVMGRYVYDIAVNGKTVEYIVTWKVAGDRLIEFDIVRKD